VQELVKEGDVGLVSGRPAHDPDRLAAGSSIRLEQARDLRHHPGRRATSWMSASSGTRSLWSPMLKMRPEPGVVGAGDEFRLMIDGGGADGEDAVWRRLGEVGGSGRCSAADEHGVASAGEDVGDAAAVVLPLPRGCRLQLKLVNK